jgi:hypothetical protein
VKLNTAIIKNRNPMKPMLVAEGAVKTSLTASAPPPVNSWRSMMRSAVSLPPSCEDTALITITSGIVAVSAPEARDGAQHEVRPQPERQRPPHPLALPGAVAASG